MKFTYFNLVNNIKSTLTIGPEETLVDPTIFNEIVNGITWNTLPQDLQKLVDMINSPNVILDFKATWYDLPKKIEQIQNVFI